MKKILLNLLIPVILISCNAGISTDKLASKVKGEINAEFKKKASSAGVSYTINSFDLLHKGGKEYSGILKTTEDGEEFTYNVDVTVDGDKYIWKIIE